jgi:Putative auto-transporter adhesin, head GIN domain
MKHLIASILLGLASLHTQAQPTKNVVVDANAEIRSVGAFSALEISGAIDAYLSQGSEDAVAISAATDELKAKIKTEVNGSTLHIYLDTKNGFRTWSNTKAKAYITFKSLSKVEASGACNVISTDAIKTNNFKLEFSGACDFKGQVQTTNFIANASGACSLKLNGNTEMAKLEASGASSIKAYDLIANSCNADASGAASIKITVTKELKASASGASSIYYKGDAIIKDVDSSGGASIKKKNNNE